MPIGSVPANTLSAAALLIGIPLVLTILMAVYSEPKAIRDFLRLQPVSLEGPKRHFACNLTVALVIGVAASCLIYIDWTTL